MSVIWSGVTEGGAIVPVQVTDAGKVVADVGSQEGLWLLDDDQIRPTDPSKDIATWGSLVLGRPNTGTSTFQRLPIPGALTLTLPASSGTLALTSDIPSPGASFAPHAYGYVSADGIVRNSFGVQRIEYKGTDRSDIYFSNPLSSLYPIVLVGMKPPGDGDYPYVAGADTNVTSSSVPIRFASVRSNTPERTTAWWFVVYDMASLSVASDFSVDNWDQAIADNELAEENQLRDEY